MKQFVSLLFLVAMLTLAAFSQQAPAVADPKPAPEAESAKPAPVVSAELRERFWRVEAAWMRVLASDEYQTAMRARNAAAAAIAGQCGAEYEPKFVGETITCQPIKPHQPQKPADPPVNPAEPPASSEAKPDPKQNKPEEK